MRLRWLIYMLNTKRARFFPWDVLVSEPEGRTAALHPLPKPVEEPASSGTGIRRAKRGRRSPGFTRPLPRNGHAASRSHSLRALRTNGRRSRDALRPNRVD